MTIKTTADGETVTTETMADRLRSVQTEPWRKMRYTDENEEAAWDVYNESLFLRPKLDEAAPAAADTAPAPADVPTNLEGQVPQFSTKWGDKELLEAVSGIKKPEPLVETEKEPEKDKQPEKAEEAKKPKGRPRGGAAAGAASRRGRAKAGSSKTADS